VDFQNYTNTGVGSIQLRWGTSYGKYFNP